MVAAAMRGAFVGAFILFVALVAVPGLGPSVVLADRCGGPARVEPHSGTVGTEFVLTIDLGAGATLRLFHEGTPREIVPLDGEGEVQYRFIPQPGDEGSWTARAEVRAAPACTTDILQFRVQAAEPGTPAPEQAGSGPSGGWSVDPGALAAAALVGTISLCVTAWIALSRWRRVN